MSNPNWKEGRGGGNNLNAQLEQYENEACMTREDWLRGQAEERKEQRAPRGPRGEGPK